MLPPWLSFGLGTEGDFLEPPPAAAMALPPAVPPPSLRDRIAGRLPTYGMDVAPEDARAALNRGLLTFGTSLMGQTDPAAIGPALEAGVETHHRTLVGADQARRQREYDQGVRDYRESQAAAAEARAQAARDAAERKDEEARARVARHQSMLERLPPEPRGQLEPLVGTDRFDVEYGMAIRARPPAEPYSQTERWRRRPDGIQELVRTNPRTGQVEPVLDETGAPVLNHPAPSQAGGDSSDDLSASGFSSLMNQMRSRLIQERGELERKLEAHRKAAEGFQAGAQFGYPLGDEPDPPAGYIEGMGVQELQARINQLHNPQFLDQRAYEMAIEQRNRIRGAAGAPTPPPGRAAPPRPDAAPAPESPPEAAPPAQATVDFVLSQLPPAESQDPELRRIIEALSLTKGPQEILALIKQYRGR